jgi:hypothetical protein
VRFAAISQEQELVPQYFRFHSPITCPLVFGQQFTSLCVLAEGCNQSKKSQKFEDVLISGLAMA